MSGEESRSQYGSGERSPAYTTGIVDLKAVDDNRTRQFPQGQQSEHPYITNQLPVRVRLPPISSFTLPPPTPGRSAVHTNPEKDTGSQSHVGSGRGHRIPTVQLTDLNSVYTRQTSHSTQGHQSEYPYTDQTSGRLRPLLGFSHTTPQLVREPGHYDMHTSPGYNTHEHQIHDVGYVQPPQYSPWNAQPPYQAFSQEPQRPEQYENQYPRIGAGAGSGFRRRNQAFQEPPGIAPLASTSQQLPLSQITTQERLRNFTTWQDALSYLEPLRQDSTVLPPSDEEIANFMQTLMAGLGGCFGPISREDTIHLARFMLRNNVIDILEQRSDVRPPYPAIYNNYSALLCHLQQQL